ncbi:MULTISPECIES: YegP family protein [unclassified Lysobacter]|uniref:YegP family protein n=1 Tax=unclassified Lysobacter TaxID=2635362 RepID=UPI001BE65DF8|nr:MULTISPECIES: YegP family protein [unclassified Lysobacter]MBT2746835.1 YegP family protein [Lysobacter sp. ISL-42]MBT2750680.1 YegP family protein [Lysobacter sp. ISL-50]MBT2779509.1 YegP family protein [Lysobacter sp. ISL-54]MBT2784653.1 YegP family protein [Lysobacter sp. ISL-52]
MAGKPYFQIYREGLKVGEQTSLLGSLAGRHPSSTHGQWRWRLVGGNGEPMAYGEAYTSKAAMLETLDIISALGSTNYFEIDGR